MEYLKNIKPINTKILFQFVEDLNNHSFHQQTKSGLMIVQNKDEQVKKNRWGKVLAVGPEASDLIETGEYVFIEALGWTNGITLEDGDDTQRVWFTDLEKVICVTPERPDEF
jgi:co-chaperonin GroES (HSP10)